MRRPTGEPGAAAPAYSDVVAKDATQRWRRAWDRQAGHYDRQMAKWDRRLFRGTREWICGKATGDVLEVAIGTGLNLPHYPGGVRLTGVELSPAMLDIARKRAAELGVSADLREGDAQQLDFPDERFDTAVCTFSMCAIPDYEAALAELHRVLKPGGRMLLADHVVAKSLVGRGLQRLAEVASVPLSGEHWRRRPAAVIESFGFSLEQRERFGPSGLVERLAARKT